MSPPKFFTKVLKKICKILCPKEKENRVKYEIKEIYCNQTPSNQTIVDIFKGEWYSSFPDQYEVEAGSISHFDFSVDPRVQWANEVLKNGLKSTRVLELGPYEAYNTWQLEKLGAKIITIENNKISYLKCLIVKEITGLNARFLHGDFIPYLEHCAKSEKSFGIVWASGVLYHQIEPLKLLELISKITPKVFIHTHYYDEDIITNNPDLKVYFDLKKNLVEKSSGFETELYYKSYRGSNKGAIFSGGSHDYSYWLRKEDIFAFLNYLGFIKITMEVDNSGHDNGPAMCFLAEKE